MPIASLALRVPSGLDLLEAGKSDSSLVGIMEDMGGVSARAFPQSPQEDAMLKVATFVVNREIWWKDAEMLREITETRAQKPICNCLRIVSRHGRIIFKVVIRKQTGTAH